MPDDCTHGPGCARPTCAYGRTFYYAMGLFLLATVLVLWVTDGWYDYPGQFSPSLTR